MRSCETCEYELNDKDEGACEDCIRWGGEEYAHWSPAEGECEESSP